MKKNEEKRADKEEEKKERINRKRDNPLPFLGNPGAPLIIIMIIIIVIISWLSGGDDCNHSISSKVLGGLLKS